MAKPGPGAQAQHRGRERVEEAMARHIAPHALGEAVRRAPVEEGTLRASGHLDPPGEVDRSAPNSSEIRIVFSTPYAAVQHERLDYEHPRGGQAKYLQSVIQEMGPRYAAALAEAWRRGLKGE